MPERHEAHQRIAARLHGSSDEELLELLSETPIREQGRAVLSLPPDHTKVFVKLLPLTAQELQHQGSTANLFGLPTFYQYRFGGCGFGAWRELDVHRLANEWVLSGQRPHFPLLHHWRVLPVVSAVPDDMQSLEFWGDNPPIKNRIAAVLQATCSAALFVEYVPHNLHQWLQDNLPAHPDPVALLERIDAALTELLTFTRSKGLLHLDAHLENVLTDGDQLYLGDYGLAVSRDFELGPDEQQFFASHQNYDLCTAITCLVYAILIAHDAGSDWRRTLRELKDGAHEALPDAVRPYLARRAPLAHAMGRFYRQTTEDLTTPYPASDLQRILTTR